MANQTSQPDLSQLVRRVIDSARGDEAIEAYAVRGRETDVRAYQGAVESLSSAESMGIGVRILVEGRQGFAHAGTFDEAVIRETVEAARDNARFATPDEEVQLATPDGVPPSELDLVDVAMFDASTDDKIAMAIELERLVSEIDPRISGVESADYGDVVAEMALASTTGIDVATQGTRASLSTYVLATAGSETQTGFGFSVGRGLGDLDPARAASDAGERATRMLGAVKPPTERTTIVFDPFVTAMFLGIIGGTFSGEAVVKGRSLFADRLGDEIAATEVTLVDDPTDPRAFGATRFDGEGLATRRNAIIENGELQQFVHNSWSARRSGTQSTGSAARGGYSSLPGVGCRALQLEPGSLGAAALYSAVGDGVLVQSVAGLHSGVNPVSGDFSTGAEGMRLTNGQVGEPLREFTIGSTLQRMLLDVIAIGNDVEWLPMGAAGVSLAVEGVTVSGS
ncbi:MAG: TldD/PmbA family protein [Actinobacteria bacterium]|nr:TldD/PmbA family protein [Actinomycetota bacterium]